jgi:hypothetical protein
MNEKVKKIQVSDTESVYMRRGLDGWRIVYPIKNDDDTWNWNNILYFGSPWRFVKWCIVLALFLLLIWGYNADVSACKFASEHMDQVCLNYSMMKSGHPQGLNFTIDWATLDKTNTKNTNVTNG